MGRKAKEAAQKKIGEWTGSLRNVSKSTKTTTNNENTNAFIEKCIPLQSHTPSDLNAMKNCSVLLDKIRIDHSPMPKKIPPAKKVPTDDVTGKDKQADAINVFDYSFDMDDAGPTQNQDEMKDIFEKLAKENKIEVKKYRPKNVKKKKPDENDTDKKATTQKRRREKQAIDVGPPKKKPNLKSKVISVDTQKEVAPKKTAQEIPMRHIDAENMANNNVVVKKLVVAAPKGSIVTATVTGLNQRKAIATLNTVNVQTRLKNRDLDNFQSTPKSSTPLGMKATTKGKENNRSLNSIFENASPLMNSTRNARQNIQKQRLQFSKIQDIQEDVPSTSTAKNDENDNAPQQNFDFDDDFDFGDNLVNEPQPTLEVDKENSLDRPSTSAAASLGRSKNTSSVLRARDQPGTSSMASSLGQALVASRTPLQTSNDKSIFEIRDTSDYHIFSPTKRRVYGRSPLKNITSEVNNTNSPSFDSMKSMPRSFGVLPKSTANSIRTINSTKDTEHTLPEASYFSSRRVAQDFDRSIDNQNFTDDCFGFDTIDEDTIEDIDETINKTSQMFEKPKKDSKHTASSLKDIRANLKRFLHNPEVESNETMKKSKISSTPAKKVKTPMKSQAKALKTPIKSPTKVVNSPAKQKRNVVFAETGAKQKDIRNAFTTKSKPSSKDEPATDLFGEFETVQDRRRSYSRPQRQRKRRISVDSEESEEEQNDDNDDEYDENGKPSKRAKRRKKTTEPNPKELEELEEFARLTKEHFAEVDSFELTVE